MIEENEEKIHALINKYNRMKADKFFFYKNEKSEKKMKEIVLSLKKEIKR